MKRSSPRRLLDTTLMLALAAMAFLASSAARPAHAQAISQGIYAGGSTLPSEVMRQLFDCYAGTTVGNDGFTFSAGSLPTSAPAPGFLPNGCSVPQVGVQGMYAAVGSGNGLRGFISNNPVEWYGGVVFPQTTAVAIMTPFPASQPPFVDSNNSANFGTYPYPRVDISFSDAPLPTTNVTTEAFSFSPTTWSTAGVPMTRITLNSTTKVVPYDVTSFGNPIQVPAFEVNVAIAVNVNSPSFQISSQIKDVSGNIVPGGAIQLTEGQMCAIFSGLVVDWSDTTTNIPYLDNNGNLQIARFSDANVGNGVTAPQAYATSSLPITAVYRADDDVTSFILTNYLHAVCPLLDPFDTYKYQSIFGRGVKSLPSARFVDLIANVVAARGNGPWNSPGPFGEWLGENGSGSVAATISDGAGQAGYIGYVGANLSSPYATTVSGAGRTNVNAPFSAALQDEDQRIFGIYVPSASATTPTFIPPTPVGAEAAWSDLRLGTPAPTWTYNDYNVYGKTFTTTALQGGVSVFGKSVLPLTNVAGAYPLSGTTFMTFYSCYQDATRTQNINDFFSWYFNGMGNSGDNDVIAIIQNNGFDILPGTWASNIIQEYSADDGGAQPIQAAGNGCTGGAN